MLELTEDVIVDALVWFCAYGQLDMKGILKSVPKRDYLRYIMYIIERTRKIRSNPTDTSRAIKTQEVFIVDMDQLSTDQLSYRPGTLN